MFPLEITDPGVLWGTEASDINSSEALIKNRAIGA